MRVLCFNVGSSSLKVALHRLDAGEARLAVGTLEIGGGGGRLSLRDAHGAPVGEAEHGPLDWRDAAGVILEALARSPLGAPEAVGHRVVHGGLDHVGPERVGDALLTSLERLVPLAPLHLPAALDVMRSVSAHRPELPQVACFDTAFHRDLPEIARRYALPRALYDQGLRRFGFHGLSYEFIVSRLGERQSGRTVVAHLGHGASLCAIEGGRPIDTTMGYTPNGGCMMGTRSGDVDPGAMIHLGRRLDGDLTRLERLVDEEAGLAAVSETSADMRALLEARGTDPRAAQAVAMFCYQVRKQIGAMAAAMGGMDALVFTAGVGERSAPVRAEICAGLEHLGVRLDPERNRRDDDVISVGEGPCTVRVIPTDEDLMVARHTRDVLSAEPWW
jgi:acetate kinase